MIVISKFFSACYFLLLTACTTNNDKNTTGAYIQSAGGPCTHCKAGFWVTKFTRVHIDGTLERFKIMADEQIRRQRKGRIVEFINYDELYFKNLTVNQLLTSKIVKFDTDEIKRLMTFDSSLNPVAKANLLGGVLSRVLVENITINFKPARPKTQPIILTADYAKILPDTMTMQFDGNMSLKTTQCEISSEVAIWSNIYNGLFFPEPFQYNNKTYKSPAFIQVTDTGKCLRVRPIHEIEYIDKLDVIEDKLFESMPTSVQLIFGLVGSPTNLNNEND